MMEHLDNNKILTDYQHGFRKKRSCESQLIITVNDLAKHLDQGKQIDCILLDFAKAFDKVSHKCLIAKLKLYGVNNQMLKWIEDFLACRTQVVIVEGQESYIAPVTSGVPQGSVLGLALFLVYINDLPDSLNSTPRLFADDCMLYRVIESEEDAEILQKDLEKLESWENKWLMQFAEDKCKVLRITRKLPRNIIRKDYKIHNHSLESVSSAKYLGVNIDSGLTFNQHVDDICRKADQTRQFLQRNIHSCHRDVKDMSYRIFVRPQLEYCCTVWDPHKRNQTQVKRMEAVQNRAARFAFNNWRRDSSVTEMIRLLEWEQLQIRRLKCRLILLHRVVHGQIAIPSTLCPYNIHISLSTRGATIKFARPHIKTKKYQNHFFPTTNTVWNGLPAGVTTILEPEAFRTKLSCVSLPT
jgi:hypothetical protein